MGIFYRGNWLFDFDINKKFIKLEFFEFVIGRFFVNNISIYFFDFFDEDSC